MTVTFALIQLDSLRDRLVADGFGLYFILLVMLALMLLGPLLIRIVAFLVVSVLRGVVYFIGRCW